MKAKPYIYGFRVGFAITSDLTGADLSEIVEHVGWNRCPTALYYIQLAKVLHPDGASATLADPHVINVVNPWQDVNTLKRFVCAFPSETLAKPADPESR